MSMLFKKPEIRFRIDDDLFSSLNILQTKYDCEKIFVIVDENTKTKCLPLISNNLLCPEKNIIMIMSGEDRKNLKTVEKIWNFLINNGVDRKSLIINLGGGMLCDIGGFAASTIKRGINYINIPTTILAMVDAALGGKTGFNFQTFKNEIGLINQPEDVLINIRFLKTLDYDNILSGYGEMIKYSLINDKRFWDKIINFDIKSQDHLILSEMITISLNIKKHFVENDPFEKNIRKALNFGHTFGHAFESLSLSTKNPVLHGKAIAWGMVCESYLSHIRLGLDEKSLSAICDYIIDTYGKFDITCNNYNKYYELMTHDKKNENDLINCTLISEIGKYNIDNYFDKNEIVDALEFLSNI